MTDYAYDAQSRLSKLTHDLPTPIIGDDDTEFDYSYNAASLSPAL